MERLRPFLGRLIARTRLTEEEEDAFLALPYDLQVLEPRERITLAGKQKISACLVVEGLCGRTVYSGQGDQQITGFYVAGDMPDLESAFVQDEQCGLQAITHMTLLRISHLHLRTIIVKFPAVAEAFSRQVMADALIDREWLVNVGSRDARTRIAHLICEMAVRKDVVSDNSFSFSFALTQTHLAEACCISAVHMNRSLQCLRKMGLIVFENRRMQVLDWEALCGEGDFTDDYLVTRTATRFAAWNQVAASTSAKLGSPPAS